MKLGPMRVLLIQSIVVAVLGALVTGGVVHAYEALWSATAHITITKAEAVLIVATCGLDGTIDPDGYVWVDIGADQTFTITPDEGYEVADVLVDDESVGAVEIYIFESVTTTHTIHATYAAVQETTSIAISPSSAHIPEGFELTLVATLSDFEGNPLQGKEINWEASLGGIAPETAITSSEGKTSAVYAAPDVFQRTQATINASFAGDDSYGRSSLTAQVSIHTWIPWTPPSHAVMIEILSAEDCPGAHQADVTITIPHVGFRVDWGSLHRDENVLSVNATLEEWTGPVLLIVPWPLSNVYELGVLWPGEYEFGFYANGLFIRDATFTVGEGTAEASRTIDPQTIAPGETVQVIVEIKSLLAHDEAVALVEDIPADWEFSSIDDDGADFVKEDGPITWMWSEVAAGVSKTVVYTLTAPDDAAAAQYTIDGLAKAAKVDNPIGGDTTITVHEALSVTDARADPDPTKEGYNTTFSVNVTGGIEPYSYLWEFGDDVTSTEASPTHNYTVAGTYNVTVTVTDALGDVESDIFLLAVAQEATAEAVRTIEPKVVAPGDAVEVMVEFTSLLDGPGDFVLMESFDALGLDFTRGSDDAHGFNIPISILLLQVYEWLWFHIAPGGTGTVMYTITVWDDAPIGYEYEISGTVSAAGVDNPVGGDTIITVAVIEEYNVTIDSTVGGNVTEPGEATFPYPAGMVVSLVAEAEDGYRFVEWTGDMGTVANVNAAETTITMNDDYSITAEFVRTYDLTVSSTEGGSVTDPGEDTFTYDAGTVVGLAAEAEVGFRFVEWTGDIADIDDPDAAETFITMNDDYSITANFEQLPELRVDTVELPDGQAGVDYEATLEAIGGTEPYIWAATGLPNGLTCSEDGVISGTPVGEVGEFTVTVTVSDAMTNTHSRELPLTISCKPGDANMDGVVNAGDITKVRRIFFGIDAPTPCADVNEDGVVNAGDLTAIRMIYFGLTED